MKTAVVVVRSSALKIFLVLQPKKKCFQLATKGSLQEVVYIKLKLQEDITQTQRTMHTHECEYGTMCERGCAVTQVLKHDDHTAPDDALLLSCRSHCLALAEHCRCTTNEEQPCFEISTVVVTIIILLFRYCIPWVIPCIQQAATTHTTFVAYQKRWRRSHG